jgi:hypothetical protein
VVDVAILEDFVALHTPNGSPSRTRNGGSYEPPSSQRSLEALFSFVRNVETIRVFRSGLFLIVRSDFAVLVQMTDGRIRLVPSNFIAFIELTHEIVLLFFMPLSRNNIYVSG